MPKAILIEQFHINVFAPRSLPVADANRISKTVNNSRFQASLRRAVRAVFQGISALRKARVTVTR